ncbi:hypothetical protein [uncultured Acinetobacter sp.]|uniref:hypothetical protein n=1 Tax=uncultured Acinetobacter sp. TaxID=165433 RepID=UPI003747F7D9
MNRSAIIFSTFVAIIIISILIISTVAMILFYWGDVNAFKDSMNIIVGIFGGLTTLGAAIIAAYLFNDWREQKNYDLQKEYVEKFSILLFDMYQLLHSQSQQILYIHAAYNKNEEYIALALEKIDFEKIKDQDRIAHYYSSFITELNPETKFILSYQHFQKFLTYLSWINEKVSNMYFEKIYNPESYSKFEAYHFIEDQLSGEQLNAYTRIFQILNKLSRVKINNQDKKLTYFELVNEFESSFEILNYEIIKYLKP